jgi:transcriptional regulator CtsR
MWLQFNGFFEGQMMMLSLQKKVFVMEKAYQIRESKRGGAYYVKVAPIGGSIT